MHGAPSVSYPVGRSPFLGRLVAALAVAGAAACSAWAALGAGPATAWSGAVACLASAALAAAWWWRTPAGELSWDGGAWSWLPQAGPQVDAISVSVALDLQRALLLRWQDAGRARWFWLDRARSPGRWDELRRAVYSPAPSGEPTRAGVPPARP